MRVEEYLGNIKEAIDNCFGVQLIIKVSSGTNVAKELLFPLNYVLTLGSLSKALSLLSLY